MCYIKKRVINKQTLYMLCFIALMIIDWTRGSQVGSTWAWTVNMTGVVMAVILFSAYSPKEFIKPVYLIYSAICVIALPVSYYWWSLQASDSGSQCLVSWYFCDKDVSGCGCL